MPRRTQVPHQEVQIISRTWISHSLSGLPRPFRYNLVFCQLLGSSPCGPTTPLLWFGLLRFRSPLLTESLLISVPGLLRWFTSPSLTPVSYFIQIFRCMYSYIRVTPFGHLRVNGYVLLTVAFRSLSRPSSPYSSIGIHHKPIFRLTILSLSSSSSCYPSLHLISFRQASQVPLAFSLLLHFYLLSIHLCILRFFPSLLIFKDLYLLHLLSINT